MRRRSVLGCQHFLVRDPVKAEERGGPREGRNWRASGPRERHENTREDDHGTQGTGRGGADGADDTWWAAQARGDAGTGTACTRATRSDGTETRTMGRRTGRRSCKGLKSKTNRKTTKKCATHLSTAQWPGHRPESPPCSRREAQPRGRRGSRSAPCR